jgi:hypothetical protein
LFFFYFIISLIARLFYGYKIPVLIFSKILFIYKDSYYIIFNSENLLLTSKFEDAVLKITDFGNSFFLSEKIIFDKPTGTVPILNMLLYYKKLCFTQLFLFSLGLH